jgi:hypothetical protein
MARGQGGGVCAHQAKATARSGGRAAEEIGLLAPLLLAWVNQEECSDWGARFAPHAAALARLRPSEPLLLYRNERVGAEQDSQYTQPTSWSMERAIAEDYQCASSRRLICALVDPSDLLCSIPVAQAAAEAAGVDVSGARRIDWLDQAEVVVIAGAQLAERRVLREPLPDQVETDPRLIRKPLLI